MKKFICIMALTLVGCGVFTHPTGIITIPRQDFINAYGLAKAIYLRHAASVADQCRQGQLSVDYCARAQAAAQEAKRLDLEVEAKLLTPEKEVNWAAVMKMLEFTAGLVL